MEHLFYVLLGLIIFIGAPILNVIWETKKDEKEKKEAEDRAFFREMREEGLREEIKKELISDMKKKKKRAKRKKK